MWRTEAVKHFCFLSLRLPTLNQSCKHVWKHLNTIYSPDSNDEEMKRSPDTICVSQSMEMHGFCTDRVVYVVKPASSNCYSTNKCDFIPQDRTKVCVHLRSTSPGVWRKFGVEIFLKNELNLRKTPTEVQVSSFICHIHDYTEIV